MSDLIDGMNALNNAIPAYTEAKVYYDGLANEKFTSSAVQKALGSSSPDFHFNYSRIVIESRLNRMEISSIASEDGVGDEILADIWTANALDQEIKDALEAALVYGDSYLIGWEDEEGFSVFYNDPMSTRVFYDIENPRKKKFAIKRWLDGEKLRVNLYYADRIEKYISKSKPKSSMEDTDFEQYFEEEQEAWPLVNETGKIPVFHLRTNRQYGTPEHQKAYGPQNAINKLLDTQISSIDFATAPQRYFLQDPEANNGVNPQDDFEDPRRFDEDDVDPVSNLKAGPGGVWSLKGIREVGQFDAPNPDTFVVPFKTFVESMSTVTSTPMHAFNVGALPSGESLRAAEAPLNKRVASLELLFGGVIADLHEYALSVYGIESKVLVSWAPVATYDDIDVWNTVKAKTEAGVPLRVALMEAGYTDEQVTEWYPEAGVGLSMEQVAKTAESLQKLGAAVTLGLISREEARRILPPELLIEEEVVDLDALVDSLGVTELPDNESIAEKANAMGVLIRAGVDPTDAAERVGLGGLTFTGAVPTSLRLPQTDATGLEEA